MSNKSPRSTKKFAGHNDRRLVPSVEDRLNRAMRSLVVAEAAIQKLRQDLKAGDDADDTVVEAIAGTLRAAHEELYYIGTSQGETLTTLSAPSL
jgi:hypothetical protein